MLRPHPQSSSFHRAPRVFEESTHAKGPPFRRLYTIILPFVVDVPLVVDVDFVLCLERFWTRGAEEGARVGRKLTSRSENVAIVRAPTSERTPLAHTRDDAKKTKESEEVALVRIDSGTMCTIERLPHLEKCYSFREKGVLRITKARQETDANYHTCRVSRKRKQKQPRPYSIVHCHATFTICRGERTKKLRRTMKRLLQKIINTSGDCF